MSINYQLILNVMIGMALIIWGIYQVVSFFQTRKKDKGIRHEAHHEQPVTMEEFLSDVVDIPNDTTIYQELGDRNYSYEIRIQLENKPIHERVFYGYSEDVSREDILEKFFYPNAREIMFLEEDGNHYYNQNRIEEISFNVRKILEDNLIQENEVIEENHLVTDNSLSDNEELFVNLSENGLESSYEALENREKDLFVVTDGKQKKFNKWKKEKPTNMKKYSAKTFNKYFFSGVLIFLFISPFALMRTFGISGRIDKLENKIVFKKDSQDDDKAGNQSQADVYQLNHFMNSFLSHYLTTSDDSEKMDSRKKELETYFSKNVSDFTLNSKEVRNFVSADLIELNEENQVSVVSYQVTYDVSQNDVTELKTEIYTIPFIQKGKGFSVVGLPAIVSDTKLTRYFEGLKDTDKGKALTGKEQEKVNKYVELFLSKYANGTTEELELYMDNVESMGQGYELASVTSVESFDYNDKVNVYVKAEFKQTETETVHTEYFSLAIEEVNKQFKITKMNHYLGGLTDEVE